MAQAATNPGQPRVRRTPQPKATPIEIPKDFIQWPFDQLIQFFMQHPELKAGVQTRMYDEWRRHQQPTAEEAAQEATNPTPTIDWTKAPQEVKDALTVISRYVATLEAERAG